ncbi:MAG: 6-phosphogluconolactonase [Micrococcaceae bacterium]
MNVESRLSPDRPTLCARAADALLEVIASAVRERGIGHVVLTGGSTGIGILHALNDRRRTRSELDWSAVHFWFGDERFLSLQDGERNSLQAEEALLQSLMDEGLIGEGQLHRVSAPEDSDGLGDAARQYSAQLAHAASTSPGPDARLPRFDVLLLGVGPDAHVASLFPDRTGPLETGETVIPVEDSPKPPPQRVSLSVEAINTADRVWFVVAGADKADAVAAVRRAQQAGEPDAQRLPATLVRGRQETLWWLDDAAAGR